MPRDIEEIHITKRSRINNKFKGQEHSERIFVDEI